MGKLVGTGAGRCTGCGVDWEHAAAAAVVGHVPHVVRSRFAFRCCRSSLRLRHDHRHDLCRIGKALLNSNMAGHMVVRAMDHGSQMPGRSSSIFQPHVRSTAQRSSLNFAFSMSTMSSVLTFDSACWPGHNGHNNKESSNWRAMLARKVQFNVSKIYRWPPRGMRSVPNLGKRQKRRSKIQKTKNQKEKKSKTQKL